MIKNKKILLIITSVILIISLLIIALVIILNEKSLEQNNTIEEDPIDVEQLEIQFNEIFNNQENEYIKTMYSFIEEKTGDYQIEAYIPFIYVSSEIDNKTNKEISDIFVTKLLQIVNNSENYTIMKIDYATSFNNNILSLAVKCILKEGNNAQRTIIKTYNYNLQNNEEINIMNIIPEQKKSEIQTQINEKIQAAIKKENTIIEQGYNVYRRNEESDIYILDNVTEFYLENGIIYIIYSYGNNNYTSEIDLIINKI